MEPEKVFGEFLTRMINHKVQFTRLAANTLIVYIECEPEDLSGITIWIDPTWHLCGQDNVLIGSRQFQEEDTEEQLDIIGMPLQDINGKAIKSIIIEKRTYDIKISFENSYYVKTFVSDPNDEYTWYITDWENKIRLYGSPKGLYTELLSED